MVESREPAARQQAYSESVLPFASSNFACDESHLLSPDNAAHHATLVNPTEAAGLGEVFSDKNGDCLTEIGAIFVQELYRPDREQLLFKTIPHLERTPSPGLHLGGMVTRLCEQPRRANCLAVLPPHKLLDARNGVN